MSVSLLLAATSCGLGDPALDEANALNRSAGQDIAEIEKLVRENKDKEALVSRALGAGDAAQARRLINESVQAIERGMEKGASAADKLTRAAALDIDPTIKKVPTASRAVRQQGAGSVPRAAPGHHQLPRICRR